MEHLNKTQLVLLTILISFVTSIATGIMTVSLLTGASSNVTQTINRVVERTIEKVETPSGNTTVKEVQVVSEDEKVTAAIAKNKQSIVRIRQTGVDSSNAFYAIGVLVSKDGLIVAEHTPAFLPQFSFSAVFPDGTISNLAIVKDMPDENVIVFKAAAMPASGTLAAGLSQALPTLGQTAIVLEGEQNTSALVGRITDLSGASTSPRSIIVDLNGPKGTPGAPLVDLSGTLLGIRRSDAGTKEFIYLPRLRSSLGI